ncbi:MAG TPA: alpha/beta fold hydrolase, partial [Pyrinomonadaceae bacterium]|nr:alpha/beta fold hydrolase [Pyrinomonadaceae bacterium]
LAHCRWQKNLKERGTLLLMHGLEGSSQSIYMLGTTLKAFKAGFNVVRLNQRTCGGTEHLTHTLYHSGMSGDVRAVVQELIERDGLSRIFICGFSMSGNIVLKYAGEEAEDIPREISGVCAVSPSIDLSASACAIERRENWIYHRNFMIYLRSRMRRKKKLFPEVYDTSGLGKVRTMRQFDERFTAQHGGFDGADDYYTRASALPLISRIRTPTLIIHAQDDPFIPYEPLKKVAVTGNPFVITLAPPHGGHVGFISNETGVEDRFWAENRIVEFCRLIEEQGGIRRDEE